MTIPPPFRRSFIATLLLLLFTATSLPFLGGCRAAPAACEPGALFSVRAALADPGHPCRDRLAELVGRVARNSGQSASVWSLDTGTGTGLVVSAVHTLGEGYLGPGGTDIPGGFRDPAGQAGATRIYLVEDGAGTVSPLASVLFILYHPELPAAESGNYLRDILPRHDFFVGVIDSQRVVMEPLPGTPGPLLPEPPAVYDPAGLTTADRTWAAAAPGDRVIMMGFPQAGEFAGEMAASVGEVLGDDEAREAIAALAALGDEEGSVPYDPEVEMLIRGQAVVGMSGGGVYDDDGRQAGILVRASGEHDGVQYVRAVRMSYVVGQLEATLASLPAAERAVFEPYLETAP
jgi:hypothetical protein